MLLRTHTAAVAGPLNALVSDSAAGAGPVSVTSMRVLRYEPAGVFTSRVHDSGDARTTWGKLTSTMSAAANITFETRTGNTASPDATWSAFAPLSAGDMMASPAGRYAQYRATLNTADTHVTPSLEYVDLSYVTDSTGPDTAISAAQVSGSTATVTFSSAAADLAGFECSIDGGSFAACTSPAAFPGLSAGQHTIVVRAHDTWGTRGAEATRMVEVAKKSGNPPAGGGGNGGGGNGGGGGAGAADVSKPKVTLAKRTVRVNDRGRVKLAFGCPDSELRCTISVRLVRGLKTVAGKKSIEVDGGETGKATLSLKRSALNRLAERGKLNVTAIVVAVDAAGNRRSSQLAMTVRAQS